jgi:hypothetical protein
VYPVQAVSKSDETSSDTSAVAYLGGVEALLAYTTFSESALVHWEILLRDIRGRGR